MSEEEIIYNADRDKNLDPNFFNCEEEPVHDCDVWISIPVKGIELKNLFDAERILRKIGITFDTGYGSGCRDWMFDWSLKGASVQFRRRLNEQEQIEHWFYKNLYDGYKMKDKITPNPNFLSCSILSDKHNNIIVMVNGFRERFEATVERKMLALGGEIHYDSTIAERPTSRIRIGYKLKGKYVTVAYNPDKRY